MSPVGGVAVPVVTQERNKAGGCVTVAGLIVSERSGTVRRVKAACCVLLKRIPTARCVLGAKCVENKREPTISRVEVAAALGSPGALTDLVGRAAPRAAAIAGSLQCILDAGPASAS